MHLTSIVITALLATAEAVLITKPATGDHVDVSKDWKVEWSAVNTDPAQFCLYLTNFIEFPPQIFPLLSQQPVQRDAHSATIPGNCYPGLRTSPYRVRAASCSSPETIFAESGDFHASQSNCPAAASTLRRVMRM